MDAIPAGLTLDHVWRRTALGFQIAVIYLDHAATSVFGWIAVHADSANQAVVTAAAITEDNVAATEQMQAAVDQIKTAVGAMSRVMVQNRAMADDSVAGSHLVHQGVATMSESASRLKVLSGQLHDAGTPFA